MCKVQEDLKAHQVLLELEVILALLALMVIKDQKGHKVPEEITEALVLKVLKG